MGLGAYAVEGTDVKEFGSMLSFSQFLFERVPLTVLAFHHSLERIGEGIEKTAKSEFGEYQPAVGPWPAWAPLAESTIEDRVQQGFTPDDPLYRTGDLREAVTHDVELAAMEVAIGVKTGDLGQIMIWHELGTERMPPRPVLGPALARNKELIEKEVGAAILAGLVRFPALP